VFPLALHSTPASACPFSPHVYSTHPSLPNCPQKAETTGY
jgi:hypothetical protein